MDLTPQRVYGVMPSLPPGSFWYVVGLLALIVYLLIEAGRKVLLKPPLWLIIFLWIKSVD